MTQTLAQPISHSGIQHDQHFVFEEASWDYYQLTLQEIGDRHIRVTYDQGRMEIMSPLPKHEDPKTLLGQLIEMLAFQTGRVKKSLGSCTFSREDLAKGLEPDECYFFQNEAKIRGCKNWDASKYPPPDLAVEIDITSRSIPREPIYAALGVPELWRYDGERLLCLHLLNGKYESRDRSIAFPFLNPAELLVFIQMAENKDELFIMREFVAWVRKNKWA